MQSSNNHKIHQSGNKATRNCKGRPKPVAIRQAQERLKNLKKKFGV